MRLIMMGTGPFAVPTLRSLIGSQHEVAALVTRPLPAVRTRGKPPRNPMREFAEPRGLRILAPETINTETARKELQALRPDLLVVCDYGQILSAELLAVAPLGGVNLHGSLLPKYRGAAPVQWAVLNGEAETGVSVIHMTPRLDAGPCLVQRTTVVADDESAADLEAKLAELGVPAVEQAIEMLAGWDRRTPLGTPQDPRLATRAPRLKKTDGQVDWTKSAARIRNQVRAMKPWPGTFTYWLREPEPLRLILDQVAVSAEPNGSAPAGTLVSAGSDQLLVATGENLLSILRIQPAGRRAMGVPEFLRGYDVAPGARFGSRPTEAAES